MEDKRNQATLKLRRDAARRETIQEELRQAELARKLAEAEGLRQEEEARKLAEAEAEGLRQEEEARKLAEAEILIDAGEVTRVRKEG